MNNITIIQIIQPLLSGWLITHFTPFQELIYKTSKLIKKSFIKLIIDKLIEMISCFKCVSFWTGLIMSQNLYIAIICAFIAWTYEKIEIRYIN
jgi:hypothetical protein